MRTANTPRDYVTFSPSRSAFAVIHQGMPICADKGTLAEALAAARQMRVTPAAEAWNGDLGQWVHLDTVEAPAPAVAAPAAPIKVDAAEVERLAEELSGANSTDRYANGWRASVRGLLRAGFDAQAVEAIIRSKWTRWAADVGGKQYGHATASDLLAFVEKQQARDPQAVRKLVVGTFGG